MSASVSRPAPPPGPTPLVAASAAARLRRDATAYGDQVATRFGDSAWTHREYFEESRRVAAIWLDAQEATGPRSRSFVRSRRERLWDL
jgi:hypothetical protein